MNRAAVDAMPLIELEALIRQLSHHETDAAGWWKAGPVWWDDQSRPSGDIWEIGG